MSKARILNLTCPKCGQDFAAQVWVVANADTDPALREALHPGRLNVVVCPQCGDENFVPMPFIYHDGTARLALVYVPDKWPDREGTANTLLNTLRQEMPDTQPLDYLLQPAFLTVGPLTENPLYTLAQQILSGQLTLEQALDLAVAPKTLAALDEAVLKALDVHILALGEGRDRADEAYILAELNAAAAAARPASRQIRLYTLNTVGVLRLRRYYHYGQPQDLDEAIEVYEEALRLKPKYGSNRASILGNLGTALCDRSRLRGQAQDLDKAVNTCEEALRLTPKDTANRNVILCNLGMALHTRYELRGQAKDLDAAVEAHEEALRLTKDAPNRAKRSNDLGNVLHNRYRLQGQAQDLDKAVEAYEEALRLTPKDTANRAVILNNLGIALCDCYGLRWQARDLDQAVEVCDQALGLTPKDAPDRVAMLNNLGTALCARYESRGQAQDLDQAVEVYKEALRLTPKNANRSGTLNNLSRVLNIRYGLREQAQDLDQTVEVCEEALRLTPKDAPDRAGCLTNLGNALRDRYGLRRQAKDLDQVVKAYEKALRLTPKDAPGRAGYLNNLGNALNARYKLRRQARDSQGAVQCYREAARVARDLRLWNVAWQAGLGLAHFYYGEEAWYEGLAACREAVDDLRRAWAQLLMREDRQRLTHESAALFKHWVACAMRAGRFREALEAAERGRTQTLVQMLADRELCPPKNTPAEVWYEYTRLRFRARALEEELRRATKDEGRVWAVRPVAAVREELHQTDDALRRLEDRIRQSDPDFLPTAAPLEWKDLASLAEPGTAVVVLRVTEMATFALIFTLADAARVEAEEDAELAQANAIEIPFAGADLNALLQVEGEGEQRRAVDGWLWWYFRRSMDVQGWHQCLEQTLGTLYTRLFAPIHARLRELRQEQGIERVVLVPSGGLALLPLHAVWWEEEEPGSRGAEGRRRRYLLDEFEITVAPSLTLYARCREWEAWRRGRTCLFAVQNPTRDLRFADAEVKAIRYYFAEQDIAEHGTATRARVIEGLRMAHVGHDACHGEYRWDSPLESALLLANGERLTLGDLLTGEVYTPQAWLHVLSACETALPDLGGLGADEFFGLPAGFLYAGSPTVIASLWAVDDEATSQLMQRLYENLFKRGMGKAQALREAQQWLRDGGAEVPPEASEQRLAVSLEGLTPLKPVLRDYSHPVWWAAFQCVGAF